MPSARPFYCNFLIANVQPFSGYLQKCVELLAKNVWTSLNMFLRRKDVKFLFYSLNLLFGPLRGKFTDTFFVLYALYYACNFKQRINNLLLEKLLFNSYIVFLWVVRFNLPFCFVPFNFLLAGQFKIVPIKFQ